MKKSIITFILIAIFSIGLVLETHAAASTTESCTEENAEQIQREQQADKRGVWDWLWGSKGYF